MKVILASGSPRRSKILGDLGVSFEVKCSDAPEVSYVNEPGRTVIENSLAKGAAVRAMLAPAERDEASVISADTIVWLDDKIYGKPRDLEEAKLFLRTLSGRTHYVYTGVACNEKVCVETSAVTFRELSDEDIEEYVARMNPLDRAGAYDIDTNGEFLVKEFNGSYENIMGLPVEPLVAWGIVSAGVRKAGKGNEAAGISNGVICGGAEKRNAPVGFFDSGVGGLSVLDEFRKMRPAEATVYLADSGNCPYGPKTADEVRALSFANVRTLREVYGCKMVVVACNTATAAAIDALRAEDPDYPYIGIEPAVKCAVRDSKSGRIGVLATEGTFNGRLYRETKERYAKGVEVIATFADEFVELVERHAFKYGAGAENLERMRGVLAEAEDAGRVVAAKIEPLLDAGCDVIVLGCTHFPHLKKLIERVCGGRAAVIDPSGAVARHAADVLEQRGIGSTSGSAYHVFQRV